MKKTVLSEKHVALGAKMVDFVGFAMPIQYHSIRAEHVRVRTTVGVFDVSHMGEFFIRGDDREKFIDRMTVNDVRSLVEGQAQYSCMCMPDAGIVDDLLIYKYPDRFMVVVNAANERKDWDWLVGHKTGNVQIENRSSEISLLAVQGREAPDVVQKLADEDISGIPYYHFIEGTILGKPATISRTGYTGEDGFELYVANDHAPEIWDRVLEVGKPFDIEPIGLGARDSLRLEMKMALYGNDIDETTNPLEAGLGWITKLHKTDFIGRSRLQEIKEQGVTRKLVAIEMADGGFPRPDYEIFGPSNGGDAIGKVTSGTVSPMLNKGIALGYVPVEQSKIGSELTINCRGRICAARIIKPPFYKRPY